jgi:5-methylcytosine-specific restriction enzyme A
MVNGTRVFRSDESFEAERVTREMVPRFLESRGFKNVVDSRKPYGKTVQQLVRACDRDGQDIVAHVRLCWNRNDDDARRRRYSATQLLSKIKNGDWIGSLQAKVRRDKAKGVTHTLVVQREGDKIVDAVLIPVDQLVGLWTAQRDLSARLIASGHWNGKGKKNHAMNGSSPTLWLHDENAKELREELASWPGVLDFSFDARAIEPNSDTLDDLSVDVSTLGRDGAARTLQLRSSVKRDLRVRATVLQRANGQCEREGCAEARPFDGFLDVHHILGVEASDRVWTCVAICPNCHREAHFSPQADAINEQLSRFASRFEPDREP